MHAPLVSVLFDISMLCCDHVNADSARTQCVMNLGENIFVLALTLILFCSFNVLLIDRDYLT